jgi:hypothetical protein
MEFNREVISNYLLNGLFSLIVFLFVIRPIFRYFLKSTNKPPEQINQNEKKL